MRKTTTHELFAAFAAQLPLLSRSDLENAIADLRGTPAWERVLVHARLQMAAIGLREQDFEPAPDPAADLENPPFRSEERDDSPPLNA